MATGPTTEFWILPSWPSLLVKDGGNSSCGFRQEGQI